MAKQALILLLFALTASAQMPPRVMRDLQLLATQRAFTPNRNIVGITAYWSLDNDSWLDSSGNGYTLTENGTVTNAAAIINDGAGFDQNYANYLSAGDNDAFSAANSNSLTICAWVKLGATNVTTALVGKQTEYILYYESNRRIRFVVYTNAAVQGVATLTRDLIPGDPYFFVGKIDHTNFTCHVRYGTTNAMSAWANSAVFQGFGPDGSGTNTSSSLLVGKYAGTTYPANGIIDEVGIWNRVLSDAEITNIWNNGVGKGWPLTP